MNGTPLAEPCHSFSPRRARAVGALLFAVLRASPTSGAGVRRPTRTSRRSSGHGLSPRRIGNGRLTLCQPFISEQPRLLRSTVGASLQRASAWWTGPFLRAPPADRAISWPCAGVLRFNKEGLGAPNLRLRTAADGGFCWCRHMRRRARGCSSAGTRSAKALSSRIRLLPVLYSDGSCLRAAPDSRERCPAGADGSRRGRREAVRTTPRRVRSQMTVRRPSLRALSRPSQISR